VRGEAQGLGLRRYKRTAAKDASSKDEERAGKTKEVMSGYSQIKLQLRSMSVTKMQACGIRPNHDRHFAVMSGIDFALSAAIFCALAAFAF
jgi:hypothetical protein